MTEPDWDASINYFRQVLQVNLKHTQTHGNLGFCYAYIGEQQAAIDALDIAIDLDPGYELALLNREMIKDLKEGEMLTEGPVKTVEYYKDYKSEGRSLIQEVYESTVEVEGFGLLEGMEKEALMVRK